MAVPRDALGLESLSRDAREERFTGGKTIPGARGGGFSRTLPRPPRRLWMPRFQQAWAALSSELRKALLDERVRGVPAGPHSMQWPGW